MATEAEIEAAANVLVHADIDGVLAPLDTARDMLRAAERIRDTARLRDSKQLGP